MRNLPRVALLIESSRTYGRGVLRGIARYAHIHGAWSFFLQGGEMHRGIPGWLKTWKGDGIIARIEDRRTAGELQKLKIPVVDVLCSGRNETIPGFDTDAKLVAKLAADFFLRVGFQNFAFCGYRGIPFSDRREAALADYLADQGKQLLVYSSKRSVYPPPHIQAMENAGMSTEKAVAHWLKKQPHPLALLACNDVMAQQVLNACREYGVKVPEEVAVMGVDNDDVLDNLSAPSLTSIQPDTEKLGCDAAALLAQMMNGTAASKGITQIPPVRVVERGSTDTLAVEDQIVVQALRFIRENLAVGISVKDVLEHVGRSRTDVENRFLASCHTTIHAELLRQRLELARSLLQGSKLGLTEIANRAGLSNSAHLCRLFRRYFQITPDEYRRETARIP